MRSGLSAYCSSSISGFVPGCRQIWSTLVQIGPLNSPLSESGIGALVGETNSRCCARQIWDPPSSRHGTGEQGTPLWHPRGRRVRADQQLQMSMQPTSWRNLLPGSALRVSQRAGQRGTVRARQFSPVCRHDLPPCSLPPTVSLLLTSHPSRIS